MGFSALVLLASVACGSSNPGPSTTSGGSSPSSGNGQVAEDLTFTGALSGHMTSAHRGDTYVCTGGQVPINNSNVGAGALTIGPILGSMGGSEYTINLVMLNYHGPDTYPGTTGAFSIYASQ